ncbi:MAG: hypothetical protein JWN45_3140 [Acidobacteriaceae bacterium]|nr:hypothetical protein [Acidobacteriaceae bacterium]
MVKMPGLERVFQWLARIYFLAVLAVASLYLLLANVAVANQWIVRSPMFNWISIVVRWYPAFYVSAVLIISGALYWSRGRKSASVPAFFAFQLFVAFCLRWFSVISNPVPGPMTLGWSFLILCSLIWVAMIDIASGTEEKVVSSSVQGPSLKAVILATIFVTGCYFCFGPARLLFVGDLEAKWGAVLTLALSVLAHLALFMLFLVVLSVAMKISGWIGRPGWRGFLGLHITLAIFGFILLRQIVLPALTFTGWVANLYALAFSSTLSFYLAAVRVRFRRLHPTDWLRSWNHWQQGLLYCSLIAAAAFACTRAVPTLDWNFLFQKVAVFGVWVAAFYVFHRLCRPEAVSIPATIALLILGTAGLQMFAVVTRSWPLKATTSVTYLNQAVSEYLKRDSSFHSLRDLARGSRINASGQNFYQYLSDNSNVPYTIPVFAPETNLVDRLEPSNQPRPNIFLFVVDSLRPDYLSPYNKAVNFTPSIEAFAAESVVIPKAFTRYAGTALAEPSIWTGTMQFHQQFIRSFAPINSLKKLLQADGYESWVAVDLVMSVVDDPEFKVKDLNKGVQEWDELELCKVLSDVQSNIDSRTGSAPLFVFAQAQNIHQVAIERRRITARHDYPGFEPRIASEVEKMDHCFGGFIKYLKTKGMYDNSIVIITSDHGDEFYEHGNFGHIASLFPEVLHIPMFFHLPASMRSQVVIDPEAASFTTDITPSLYYLLGHRPLKKNPLFGKPLFATTLAELRSAQFPYYMVASSYSPIYGVLDRRGDSLFIADALNHENYFFDLAHDPQAKENRITFSLESQNELLLTHEIDAIADFYQFKKTATVPQTKVGVASGHSD